MKNIYILGSINTDLVVSSSRMPISGETLMGNGFISAHGGKGANQAVAAARNGAKVYFCGAVGDDDFGKSALDSLKKEGIDCKHVKVIKRCSSGIAVIIVVDGDNRIILDSGANYKITKDDIDVFLKSAKKDDIFLTQLEVPLDVVGYAMKVAKEKRMYVVLNPAPATKEIIPYIKYADMINPNETEAKILGGIKSLKSQCDTVIMTLGAKGYRILSNGNDQIFDCLKVKAVDTTAAGDTFCGAMLASFVMGNDLIDAAKYGSKAASIACTKKGAQPSIPTSKEVQTYFYVYK